MKPRLLLMAIFASVAPNLFAGDFIPADDKYAKELLSPNWEVVEKHFGKPVPESLKAFYRDPKKVLRKNFNLVNRKIAIPENIYINYFEEIGPSSVNGFFEGFERFIPFASDGGGGVYVIDIAEKDPKVYYHIYDIGKGPKRFRFTGLLLSEFLSSKTVKAEE